MEATISAQDVITFTQDKDASGAKGAIANLMKQKIMVALEGKKKTIASNLMASNETPEVTPEVTPETEPQAQPETEVNDG